MCSSPSHGDNLLTLGTHRTQVTTQGMALTDLLKVGLPPTYKNASD
jgi:hypothetical protein